MNLHLHLLQFFFEFFVFPFLKGHTHKRVNMEKATQIKSRTGAERGYKCACMCLEKSRALPTILQVCIDSIHIMMLIADMGRRKKYIIF